jgi:hypothetical protein
VPIVIGGGVMVRVRSAWVWVIQPITTLFDSGVEGCSVALKLGVAVGDGRPGCGAEGGWIISGLGVSHGADRSFDAVRREGGGQPGVERVGEGVLPQVDVAGVFDLVDEGVFLGRRQRYYASPWLYWPCILRSQAAQ